MNEKMYAKQWTNYKEMKKGRKETGTNYKGKKKNLKLQPHLVKFMPLSLPGFIKELMRLAPCYLADIFSSLKVRYGIGVASRR